MANPKHRTDDPQDAGARTGDWTLLGLADDPAKGDSAAVRLIAYWFQERADAVDQLRGKVQAMMGDESLTAWTGASADAFGKTMEPFPNQLAVVHQAYGDAAAALTAYAGALDDAQWDAAGAYSRGAESWRAVDISPTDGRLRPYGSLGAFRSGVDSIMATNPSAAKKPDVADDLVSARVAAETAGTAWTRAGKTCQDALHKAADLMATAVGAGALSFDDQLARYGGRSSDLVLVQHGDAAFVAAVDKVLADSAKKDAADLATALQNPDSPQSKAVIDKVGKDLLDAQDDPAYLQAFYGAGGAGLTARLMMRLAPPDGRLLAKPGDRDAYGEKALIAEYAAGVAGATRLADQHRLTLPDHVWDPLWQGDTQDRAHQIPAALLLAFGPKGDQYGHTFLADAGTRILHFDGSSQQPAPVAYGAAPADRSYNIDGNTWGLAPDILARVGENAAACRDLLDPTRSSDAQADSNYKSLLYWVSNTPYMPGDAYAAAIIHNATTDVTGHPESSLAATAALFRNLDGEKLTPNLAMVVSQASAAHLDSLMQDATDKMVPGTTFNGIIPMTQQEFDNVLKSFAGDQHAVQNLDGAIGSRALGLSRLGDFGAGNGTSADMEALKQLGNLQGEVNLHQQQAGVDLAHQEDKSNAMWQNWIRTVTGEGNALGPVPLKVIHNANPAASPFYEMFLPTDNAAKAMDGASYTLSAGASALDVPLVQGMIDRGQIVPPPGAAWFHDGIVDLSNPDARNQFNYWHDHEKGPGMDLVRTMSNTVTGGYRESGMKWDLR